MVSSHLHDLRSQTWFLISQGHRRTRHLPLPRSRCSRPLVTVPSLSRPSPFIPHYTRTPRTRGGWFGNQSPDTPCLRTSSTRTLDGFPRSPSPPDVPLFERFRSRASFEVFVRTGVSPSLALSVRQSVFPSPGPLDYPKRVRERRRRCTLDEIISVFNTSYS